MKYNNQVHPFHLVDPSPWPIVSATGAFAATFGGVMYFHSYQGGFMLLNLGLFIIVFGMFVWWRDVIREGTFEGQHTKQVELGLRMGMVLFIVSEIMFFFAFFWAFFDARFY
jgi:cytochrome c oxidase subunit 3